MTNTYRTNDRQLAAVLALTFPVEAIDRHHPEGVRWVFRCHDALDELIGQYWRGEVRVEPRAYAQRLQSMGADLAGDAA